MKWFASDLIIQNNKNIRVNESITDSVPNAGN